MFKLKIGESIEMGECKHRCYLAKRYKVATCTDVKCEMTNGRVTRIGTGELSGDINQDITGDLSGELTEDLSRDRTDDRRVEVLFGGSDYSKVDYYDNGVLKDKETPFNALVELEGYKVGKGSWLRFTGGEKDFLLRNTEEMYVVPVEDGDGPDGQPGEDGDPGKKIHKDRRGEKKKRYKK